MSATTVCVFLLACLSVAVRSEGLGLFDLQCPPDAHIKLEKCMSTLERITRLNLLPEHCGAAMEALRCSKTLTTACFDSDAVVAVLSKHDLTPIIATKPLCLGK